MSPVAEAEPTVAEPKTNNGNSGFRSSAEKSVATAPTKPRRTGKPKVEASLTQAIRRLGGLPSKLARDVTGETPFQANRMHPGLFRKNGIDLSTHVHNGSLDDFLPPAMRSDVRDESGTVNTDEAIA